MKLKLLVLILKILSMKKNENHKSINFSIPYSTSSTSTTSITFAINKTVTTVTTVANNREKNDQDIKNDNEDNLLKLRRYLVKQLWKQRFPTDKEFCFHVICAYHLENDPVVSMIYQQLAHQYQNKYNEKIFDCYFESTTNSIPEYFEIAMDVDVSKRVSPINYITIDPSKIILVDNKKSLNIATHHILSIKPASIGLDLEFIPDCLVDYHGFPSSCQILQISTKTIVFLFDLQKWESLQQNYNENHTKNILKNGKQKNIDEQSQLIMDTNLKSQNNLTGKKNVYWGIDELLLELFNNKQILKIGMGFKNDLKRLADDFPDASCFKKTTLSPYFELNGLLKHLPKMPIHNSQSSSYTCDNIKNDNYAHHISYSDKKLRTGLAGLAWYCLGKPLNKFEQVSNWSLRPLRRSQILYAAIDAWVEVKILNVLRNNYPAVVHTRQNMGI